MDKLFVVLRGLPGSGKSTLAKELAGKHAAVVLSTDDYFYINGKYCFDPHRLGEYHHNNYLRAKKAMDEGKNIILDNTNVLKSHYLPYVVAASRRGYLVLVKTIGTPKDPEAWAVYHARNVHGVPYGSIRRMGQQFEL